MGPETLATASQGDYRPQPVTPPRFDWGAWAAGVTAGVFVTLIITGITTNQARKRWAEAMDREAALYQQAAERAYDSGVVAGARLRLAAE